MLVAFDAGNRLEALTPGSDQFGIQVAHDEPEKERPSVKGS